MNDIWTYSKLSPPTDEQFAEIGNWLIDDLSRYLQISFEAYKRSVEPKSWFHADIRGSCAGTLFPITYDGIVVYGFRADETYVDVVLLAFVNGARIGLATGENILTVHRTKGGWSPPCWERDTYREWECDHLPDLPNVQHGDTFGGWLGS